MISTIKVNAALTLMANWIRQAFNTHNVKLNDLQEKKANMLVGDYLFTQAEVDMALSTTPNQGAIFNQWYRYSHDSSNVFPAIQSETLAWAYDQGTGKISNTTNSLSFIGVVSKKKYDNYQLETKLSSSNWDDDDVGVLLAWYKDPVTGKEHTLSALRSPGGKGTLYNVVLNHWQGASMRVVANGASKVTWGNGASGALSLAQSGYQVDQQATGWGGQAARNGTDGSVKLWVDRNADTITVWTSQWENPEFKDPNTALVINLNGSADLQKFRGPSPYGFCALSQQDSFWDVKSFTAPNEVMFDFVNRKVYKNVNGVWTITTEYNVLQVGTNLFMWNPAFEKLIYMVDPVQSLYWQVTLKPVE